MDSNNIQHKNDVLCFAVFDQNSKQLLYSKYNFNFDAFKDYIKTYNNNYNNLTKNEIFYEFLLKNETNLGEPFVVKEELKQYFLPITQEIQAYFDDYSYLLYGLNYNKLSSYITNDIIMKNEFNLTKYDFLTEISNVCDFFHIQDNLIYSKYNFNFTLYSNDFNIYGSKITIFSDLLIRLLYLSGNVHGLIGFKNIPEKFNKYFYLDSDNQITLKNYIEIFGVFSPFLNVQKSNLNIDYELYLTTIKNKYNVNLNSINEAKIYYLKNGQFQQDEIKFISKKDDELKELNKSICSIVTHKNNATGILIKGPKNFQIYNNTNQIYLVTCYHFIEDKTKETIFANCYYKNDNIRLMFKIIGYDIHTDICIAMYDHNLDYNIAFFPENQYDITNKLHLLELYDNLELYTGQDIYTIGNTGLIDNDSYMSGKIMDANYCGNFVQEFILSSPPCILTNIHIALGQSGSPLLIQDKVDNKLKCVGIINAKLGDEYQFSFGITSHLLNKIINNCLNNWFNLIEKYGNNDIENIYYNIQDIFQKKWFGAVFQYFNMNTSDLPEFNSFSYNQGILIKDFILGFNLKEKQFIYNYDKLRDQNVVKINTPLLNTRMYQRYLYSANNVPIILKSIKLFDSINGEYKTFQLGKNNEQSSIDILTYGLKEMSTTMNDTKYTNIYLRHYDSITLSYYYYNGGIWMLDTEEVGGNDSSWYNEYADNFGHSFKQHKFEFPNILIPYLSPFMENNSDIIKIMAAKRGDRLDICPFCKKFFPSSILRAHVEKDHRKKR